MTSRTSELQKSGLQKIDIRFPLELPEGFNSDCVLAVFGRWRLEEGEEIIDLADYGHVPDGPGCLLVSHRWHFGISWIGGKPALLYSSRSGLSGDLTARLGQAIRACLEKSRRLLTEKEIPSSVVPHLGELCITINDRVLFPNTESSDADVRPAVGRVADQLYGQGAYSLDRESDPTLRVEYRLTATARDVSWTWERLLAAL